MAVHCAEPQCPDCGSARIWRYGQRNGRRLSMCQTCTRQFGAGNHPTGRRYSDETIAEAVRSHYLGATYRDSVAKAGSQGDVGTLPAPATVMRWVREFTVAALRQVQCVSPVTGSHWVLDHSRFTPMGLHCWQVLDRNSGYQLAIATHRELRGNEAVDILKGALSATRSPLDTVHLRSCPTGDPGNDQTCRILEQNFPGLEIISTSEAPDRSPFVYKPDGPRYSEPALSDKLARIRTPESLSVFFRGWGLSYNFMEPWNRSSSRPASAVMTNPPFSSWHKVITLSRRERANRRNRAGRSNSS